jgi:hypothetical protein
MRSRWALWDTGWSGCPPPAGLDGTDIVERVSCVIGVAYKALLCALFVMAAACFCLSQA